MSNNIKLLISPRDLEEAKIVISSKVHFIDCKNPSEGSLGANYPWIIKSMKALIPLGSTQLLSATIGDFPNLPGSAALAALGAAVSGADIIKVGIEGPKNEIQGIKLMEKVVRSVKDYNKNVLVVAAGYADQSRMNGSPEFLMIPTIAAKAGADIAMLDTYFKDEKGLFDFLNIDQLIEFKEKAKESHLQVALAGNLKFQDLDKIKQISPDIIGIRGLVWQNNDRLNGTIQANLINELKTALYN